MATRITSGNTVQDGASTTIDLPAFNLQAHDALWIFIKHEGANATRTPSVVGATSVQSFKNGAAVSHSNGDLNGQQFVIEDAAADAACVIRLTLGATKAFRRLGAIQYRPDSGKVFTFTLTTNESSAQGTSGTPDAGSLTTPGAAVLVAGFGEYDIGAWTAGTGWTKTVDPVNSFMMEDRIEAAGGTFDPASAHSSMAWVAASGWLDEVASGGITGTLAKTLGDATAAGTGTVAITGAAAKTLGAATAAAAGSVPITGAAAVTLGAATLVAAGSSSDEIIGTLDKTLGAATAAGAGSVAITGAAAPTLGAAAAAAAGAVDITGQGAATLGAATVHASDASTQAPPTVGGDIAGGKDHRGYDMKRAKLRLKKDRDHEQSIRQIYRELTAYPVTRDRAEAVIAPPIVERDDESARQHAARVAARDRALRLEQLSAEKEIALRMLHQELREAQHEDDEKAVIELLGMVL